MTIWPEETFLSQKRYVHAFPEFPRSFVFELERNRARIESNKGEIKRQPSTIISRFISPRFPFDFPHTIDDIKAIHVDLLALFPIFYVSLSPLSSLIHRGIALYAPSCDSRVCNFHSGTSVEFIVFTFNFIFTFSRFLNLRKK